MGPSNRICSFKEGDNFLGKDGSRYAIIGRDDISPDMWRVQKFANDDLAENAEEWLYTDEDLLSLSQAETRKSPADNWRTIVYDMVSQLTLSNLPTKFTEITKEPLGSDHVVYMWRSKEEHANGQDRYRIEFHLDPETGYCSVYVFREADDANGHDVALDNFVIDDLEDYALSEVDRIQKAIDDDLAKGGYKGSDSYKGKKLDQSQDEESNDELSAYLTRLFDPKEGM